MRSDPPSPAPIRDIGMRYDASRSIPLVSNREMFWALENTVSTVCVVGLRMICAHAAELPLAQASVRFDADRVAMAPRMRSEEHTSELQSLMRTSYAVFCLKNKKKKTNQ